MLCDVLQLCKQDAEGELCFVLLHGISYKPFGEWDSSVNIKYEFDTAEAGPGLIVLRIHQVVFELDYRFFRLYFLILLALALDDSFFQFFDGSFGF
jgi:hypothetical protein